MSFEHGNPFGKSQRPPSTPRTHLAGTLLGVAGRRAADRLSKRRVVKSENVTAPSDGDLGLGKNERREYEKQEHLKRLLELGYELAEKIEKAEDQVGAYLALGRVEQEVYVKGQCPAYVRILDILAKQSDLSLEYCLIDVVRDKDVPRSVIDALVLPEDESHGFFVSKTLLCKRDLEDGVPVSQERLDYLTEEYPYLDEAYILQFSSWGPHGFNPSLQMAYIQFLIGESVDSWMSRAITHAENYEPETCYDDLTAAYMHFKEYHEALSCAKNLTSNEYEGFRAYEKILQEKNAPLEVRREAYDLLCLPLKKRYELEEEPGEDETETEEGVDVGAEEWETSAEVDEDVKKNEWGWLESRADWAVYNNAHAALQTLRLRNDVIKWEPEFGPLPFPVSDFDLWIQDQIDHLAPKDLAEGYKFIAQMRHTRGEDPSRALQEMKRASLTYASDEKLKWLQELAEVEAECGYDPSETCLLIESLLDETVPWYRRIDIYCSLVMLTPASKRGSVEVYVRRAQEIIDDCLNMDKVPDSLPLYLSRLVKVTAEAAVKCLNT